MTEPKFCDEIRLAIDAELLRAFVPAADSGGPARAARALNRTRSVVSMQIKKLENATVGGTRQGTAARKACL